MKTKDNKGITLISLVVTIIVLLILVGITIKFILGENGIIEKSTWSKWITEYNRISEAVDMHRMVMKADKYETEQITENLKDYPVTEEVVTVLKESTLETTIKEIHSEEPEYESSLRKINLGEIELLSMEDKYAIDIKDGKIYDVIGHKRGKKIYHIPDFGINKKGEIVETPIDEYVINYELNGGKTLIDAPKKFTIKETISFPIPERDGYIFEGWYLSNTFDGESIQETNKSMTSNITIYAKWIEETQMDYFEWRIEDGKAVNMGLSDKGLMAYTAGTFTELVIPEKYIENGESYLVTKIVNNSVTAKKFASKDEFKKLIIPDGVETIDDSVFTNCKGITELQLPISMQYKSNESPFSNCCNINKITITKGIGQEVDFQKTTNSNNNYYTKTPWYESKDKIKTIIIEEGITKIGNYMFYNYSDYNSYATNETNVIIPNTIIEIGDYAFSGCSRILIENNWDFIKHLNVIGKYAFNNCKSISGELVIPDSITLIQEKSFYKCEGIEKLIIFDNVRSIADNAFANCKEITEMQIPISIKYISNGSPFSNCSNIETITITKGNGHAIDFQNTNNSNDDYYTKTPWYESKDKIKTIIIEEGITKIGNCMFYNLSNYNVYATNETNMIIPNTITEIGDIAFKGCSRVSYLYKGTEIEWEAINIGNNNTHFTKDRATFNYEE